MTISDFAFSFTRPKEFAISLTTGRVMRGKEGGEVAETVKHLFAHLPATGAKSEIFASVLAGNSDAEYAVVGRPNGDCEIYRHDGRGTKHEPACPRIVSTFLECSR